MFPSLLHDLSSTLPYVSLSEGDARIDDLTKLLESMLKAGKETLLEAWAYWGCPDLSQDPIPS